MKILLLQTNIKWESAEYNRTRIQTLIESSYEPDLIILPEMFTTGFCTSPYLIAEKAETSTLEWMQCIAKKKQAAIAGSVAVVDNGTYYNRFYFVKADGRFEKYDKRHLFTVAGEDKLYNKGNKRVIVEYNGFRILLQICYDLRFPVFSRNKRDYDMIIYVANWPVSRISAWDTLIRARAIENVCYVAALNRTGKDLYSIYNGHSALIDYMGRDIVEDKTNKEQSLFAEIDIRNLVNFRNKFPALNDSDQFELIDH